MHWEGDVRGQGYYCPAKEGLSGVPEALPCIDIIQGDELLLGGFFLAIQGAEDPANGV